MTSEPTPGRGLTVPLDSWTGEPCLHDGDDLGRYEVDVCHGCGADVSAPARTPSSETSDES